MNKLNRFYLSQNISIDNALSMNQILHQIVNQIKEIVDFINNLELRANEYTDEQIRILNDQLQEQLAALEQTVKTYTNDSINTYNAEVINPQLTTIRNTIDTINRTLNNRIDNEVGVLNRRIDSEVSTLNRIIEDTKTYLEDLIKKGMSYVYSSISGLHLPLQDVLGEIGNVLKQTLSYNWNALNDLKSFNIDTFNINLNDFILDYSGRPNTKGVDYSKIKDENGHKYVYFEWDCESELDSLSIGGISYQSYGRGTAEDVIDSPGGPINLEKISSNKARADFSQIYNSNYTYYMIGLDIPGVSNIFSDTSKVKYYYEYENPITNKITFNSIKLAMQELNINWNSLIYTGVNTFYELNETEKLFDTDGVKSDYFTGNKYKVIHNNFDSDFFAYEEEENNENEGE